ncbi:unnamed protein product [Porites evermanni]|uniref:Uncharacterized protein n=1 Tax=Porites evermanni TaxID=104178 RepID=A0ABN8LEI1_9CNID|nr:unnamed protein product [Porites evermanni]
MSARSEESLKKDNNDGKSDSDGDFFDKIRSLFGDVICQALQREEISDIDLVENLASREADAPIYSKLGFSYGKAVRFKKEFGSKQKSHNSPRPSSPAPKPTMAAMSTYTPEMRQLYLSKRKKIGLLATKKWDDKLPKFNSPESKAELKAFAEQITQECGIPEINFTEEGIAQHIKTFFSEEAISELGKIASSVKKKCKVNNSASSEEKSSGGSTCSAESGGGDTDILEELDEDDDHGNTTDLELCRNESPIVTIVKRVFSRVLKRDEIVEVLKNKFSVAPKNITGLAPTQLMSVLAKKLVKHRYCNVKEGKIKNLKEDITVIKEIEL